MTPLLSQLRQACDQQHQALHVHPLLAPLDRGPITFERYKNILAMFYAAYRETESEKPVNAWPDSPITDWLRDDMQTHAVQPLNWASPKIALDTESKLLGYLYVKQGSTLGGQRITKHLGEALGIDPARNRFFNGYGEATGARWQQFKKTMESIEPSLDRDEVIATARGAFAAIQYAADRAWEEAV